MGNGSEFSPVQHERESSGFPVPLDLRSHMSEEDTEGQRKQEEADFLSALHYHRIMSKCKVLTLNHALNLNK